MLPLVSGELEVDLWSKHLREAQDGNKASYREFLEEVYRIANNFLSPRVTSAETREEIIQDAVLSIHRGLSSYDRSYPAKAWVYSILRNKLTDHFRKIGSNDIVSVEIDLIVSLAAPENTTQSVIEANQWLQDTLIDLAETQRRVFVLAQIEGLELKEVADKLGLSVANVKVSLHRARAILKEKYLDQEKVL